MGELGTPDSKGGAAESGGTTHGDDETVVTDTPSYEGDAGVPPGTNIGRYVVLEEVGRGGMGRVLRAYDPKLEREVALKVLRGDALGGAPGESGSQRLIAEARAMAKLSHPNVVAVHDVEPLDADRLVLAMEYVAGTTLSAWLRKHPRGWREVVDRFSAAGRGLAAAHKAGLLHRDFKPANVLVGKASVTKVTDFGLAKVEAQAPEAIPDPLSASNDGIASERDSGQSTQAGAVMGTPPYMAPEQHRGEALTPAADQYSFCVALWEALCGAGPFDKARMVAHKHEGPPPWPKAEVPRKIADAIVRGLSPRPSQRWPSVEALLVALAYDPRTRRNRVLMAVGALGLAGALGVGLWSITDAQSRKCAGAREHLAGVWDAARRTAVHDAVLATEVSYAQTTWERAAGRLDEYADAWVDMHTEACEATTVRAERSDELMDLQMGCLHRAKLDLEAVTEVLANADRKVVSRVHDLVGGLHPLDRCEDLEALQAEVEPPRPHETDAVENIRRLVAQSKAQREAGRYDQAKTNVDEARQRMSAIEYGPVQTEVALEDSRVLDRLGKYEEATAALEDVLRSASRWRQWEPMQVASTHIMFVLAERLHRPEEALRYLPVAQGLAGDDAAKQAATLGSLAIIWRAQGKYPEAEASYREALALRERSLGSDHFKVTGARNNLAIVLRAEGKLEEAEAEHRKVLATWETQLGPDHPKVATSLNNLTAVLLDLGRPREAEQTLRRAVEIRERELGRDHPEAAVSRSNLALALRAQGKHEESETELRRARDVLIAALGPDHPHVGKSYNNLAITLLVQGKYAEAEAEHRKALTLWTKAMGPDHPHVATAQSNLAAVLIERRKYDEAVELAQRAWTQRQRDDIPVNQQAETAYVLARALWNQSEDPDARARAVALGKRALDGYTQGGDAHAELADEVRTWLRAHGG